jgi:hypothetical protein
MGLARICSLKAIINEEHRILWMTAQNELSRGDIRHLCWHRGSASPIENERPKQHHAYKEDTASQAEPPEAERNSNLN